MSQEEAVEQITKTPPELQAPQLKKEKDPKKVAAGKKLAEYNKLAKEALKREKETKLKKLIHLGKVQLDLKDSRLIL